MISPKSDQRLPTEINIIADFLFFISNIQTEFPTAQTLNANPCAELNVDAYTIAQDPHLNELFTDL